MLETYCPLITSFPRTSKFFDNNLPESKFKSVVFPEPEGPKIAVIDPAENLPEQTLSIVLIAFYLRYFPGAC